MSPEEGLEQDFNSLDAQREACAAYILSQKHEGWTARSARCDDGGYSRGARRRYLGGAGAARSNTVPVTELAANLAARSAELEEIEARTRSAGRSRPADPGHRQRTTLCTSGFGPSRTHAANVASCAAVSLRRRPRAPARFVRPASPACLWLAPAFDKRLRRSQVAPPSSVANTPAAEMPTQSFCGSDRTARIVCRTRPATPGFQSATEGCSVRPSIFSHVRPPSRLCSRLAGLVPA